jgi:hypothetical protein
MDLLKFTKFFESEKSQFIFEFGYKRKEIQIHQLNQLLIIRGQLNFSQQID